MKFLINIYYLGNLFMRGNLVAAVKQWVCLVLATPLLLGPACMAPRKTAVKLLNAWQALMLKITGTKIFIHGHSDFSTERGRNALYVHLNQQTHLASLLYSQGMPMPSIIMNIEFSLIPFIGWVCRRLDGISIVRERPESAKAVLKSAVERLRSGENFVISIEGKRSVDGNLSQFKKGPVVIAIEAQCDIIPFMTLGESVIWPSGQLFVTPGGKIDVVFFPRISTIGASYSDRERIVGALRSLAETEKSKWEEENKDYITLMREKRR
jgi:1-acyl-sn-glycerol-3-phosphate acyltransferase